MPQLGFTFGREQLTFEEAIQFAATGTAPVPVEFLKALIPTRNDTVPTASVLGGCLRQFELKQVTEYYESYNAGKAALFGTAMHKWLEQYKSPTALVEHRVEATLQLGLPEPFQEVQVGGTADYIDPEYRLTGDTPEGVIRDWKTKAFAPQKEFYADDQHRVQLNIYHWAWVQQGHAPLKYWEILYFAATGNEFFFRGELAPVDSVEKWLRKRFRTWARHRMAGTLPPVIPQFHERDKYKKPVKPCAYCPVREACLAAYQQEGHDQLTPVGTPDGD